MSKRCYIVGAGEFSNKYKPMAGDFIIAADAGFAYLEKIGIEPDLVVGDFDSLGAPPKQLNVMQSPAEKDDTDMMLAVNEALERGYEILLIDGAMGGRPDHTMANYQILTNIASRGATGILLGDEMCATVVKNKSISFLPVQQVNKGQEMAQIESDRKDFISIFSLGGKAEGVSISGLKYNLEDATLSHDYPIGVSNEFTDRAANISVKSGILLVFWKGDLCRLNM